MGIHTPVQPPHQVSSNDQTALDLADFSDLGEAISDQLDHDAQSSPDDVGALLSAHLAEIKHISTASKVPNCAYERRIVYIDTEGRFTILCLIWAPGACTPIHGHAAWGVVGVKSGSISNISYCKNHDDDGSTTLSPTCITVAKPGTVVAVSADPDCIHALHNHTGDAAVSIHIYGMDLSQDQYAINIVHGPEPYQH